MFFAIQRNPQPVDKALFHFYWPEDTNTCFLSPRSSILWGAVKCLTHSRGSGKMYWLIGFFISLNTNWGLWSNIGFIPLIYCMIGRTSCKCIKITFCWKEKLQGRGLTWKSRPHRPISVTIYYEWVFSSQPLPANAMLGRRHVVCGLPQDRQSERAFTAGTYLGS